MKSNRVTTSAEEDTEDDDEKEEKKEDKKTKKEGKTDNLVLIKVTGKMNITIPEDSSKEETKEIEQVLAQSIADDLGLNITNIDIHIHPTEKHNAFYTISFNDSNRAEEIQKFIMKSANSAHYSEDINDIIVNNSQNLPERISSVLKIHAIYVNEHIMNLHESVSDKIHANEHIINLHEEYKEEDKKTKKGGKTDNLGQNLHKDIVENSKNLPVQRILDDVHKIKDDVNISEKEITEVVSQKSGKASKEIDYSFLVVSPAHDDFYDNCLKLFNTTTSEVESALSSINDVTTMTNEISDESKKEIEKLKNLQAQAAEQLENQKRITENLQKELREQKKLQMETMKNLEKQKSEELLQIEALKQKLQNHTISNTKYDENMRELKNKLEKDIALENENKIFMTSLEARESELHLQAQKDKGDLESQNAQLMHLLEDKEKEIEDLMKYGDKNYIDEIHNQGHSIPLVKCFFQAGAGRLGLTFNTTERGIYVSEVTTDGNPQVAEYPEVKKGCLLHEVYYFELGTGTKQRVYAKDATKLITQLVDILQKNQSIYVNIIIPPEDFTKFAFDQYVMTKATIIAFKASKAHRRAKTKFKNIFNRLSGQ